MAIKLLCICLVLFVAVEHVSSISHVHVRKLMTKQRRGEECVEAEKFADIKALLDKAYADDLLPENRGKGMVHLAQSGRTCRGKVFCNNGRCVQCIANADQTMAEGFCSGREKFCVDGMCSRKTAEGKECTKEVACENKLCDDGRCVQCMLVDGVSQGCGENEICSNNRCQKTCPEGCAQHQKCNDGECVAKGCEKDDECGTGYNCQERVLGRGQFFCHQACEDEDFKTVNEERNQRILADKEKPGRGMLGVWARSRSCSSSQFCAGQKCVECVANEDNTVKNGFCDESEKYCINNQCKSQEKEEEAEEEEEENFEDSENFEYDD